MRKICHNIHKPQHIIHTVTTNHVYLFICFMYIFLMGVVTSERKRIFFLEMIKHSLGSLIIKQYILKYTSADSNSSGEHYT